MDSLTNMEGILKAIRGIEGVKKASVVSRNGMFVHGDSFEDNDAFSAMSAIIMGAAENALRNIAEARYVLVNYDGGVLVVAPAGDRGILVVQADEDVFHEISPYLRYFDNII